MPKISAVGRRFKLFLQSVCEISVPAYAGVMLTLETLAELLEQNRAAASARVKEFSIGGRKFNFNSQPAIMGVVNLSADSWYRESVCLSADAAIQRGRVLAAQGAQIVDVGAESTLAHAARAGEAAQKSKLIPVIQGVARGENSRVGGDLFSRRHSRELGGRREHFESDRHRRLAGNFQNGGGATMRRSSSVTSPEKMSARSAILI